MKRLLSLASICLSICVFNVGQISGRSLEQAQEWGYVNSLTDEWLRKICTQGLDTVYIVGENGLIARSTDQGETWEKQYFPNQAALNDIIFIDHYTGFAVGEQGTILKTTDAGENWFQATSGTVSHINAVAAAGLNNIWAVGDNSLILHSTDKGETWEQVNILPENDRKLLGIAFRNTTGYFIGENGFFYQTEDGGATWEFRKIFEYQNQYTLFNRLNTTEHFTYLVSVYDNYLFKIQNNSIVEEKNLSEEGILCSEMLALHFQNDTTAYCIGRVPVPTNGSNPTPTVYIKKSNNCGSSWQQTDVITFSGFEQCDMQFVNDTLGYAIIGKKLLKIPALPGSINPYPYSPNGITNMNSNKLILKNINNSLFVKSVSQPIVCIEIADITGHTILRNNYSDNYSEVSIVLPQFQSNICLIKITLSNYDSYTIKWIKH